MARTINAVYRNAYAVVHTQDQWPKDLAHADAVIVLLNHGGSAVNPAVQEAIERGPLNQAVIDQLPADHSNARTLAEGLSELPGIDIDLDRVQTNLVVFRLTSMSAEDFLSQCAARGVKGGGGYGRVRFVTHNGIGAADVQRALEVCSEVLAG